MKTRHLIFVLLLGLVLACSKDNIPLQNELPEKNNELLITSISPAFGGPGRIVEIEGLGFSGIAEENTVTFDGITAKVEAASPNRILTVVPDKVTTGPVQVQVAEEIAVGPVFTYDERLAFIGDYKSELYEMRVAQVSNGTIVLDTTITVRNSSDIDIGLVDGSVDEVALDIEEFLEDGLNIALIAFGSSGTVLLILDEDVIAQVSGNAFEFKNIDITITAGNDESALSKLKGEGILQEHGTLLLSFEYVLVGNNTRVTFSAETELVKK